MNKIFKQSGFSLIGLIGALSVLAVLISFVLLELDPGEKINQSKDARRKQDVLLIAYALDDYMKNNQGALPDGIVPTSEKSVLCTAAAALDCDTSADIDCLVLDRNGEFLSQYLEALPIDADKTSDLDSGYYLQVNVNSQVVVGACEVSDSSSGPISYQTTIAAQAADPAWDCTAAGGYEYGGHCWFKGSDRYKNCTTVCSDNSLSCETGVSTASWTNCAVHLGLEPTGCNYGGVPRCTSYNVNYYYLPAFLHSATFYPGYCYYDYNAASVIDCNAATHASYRYVCPCLES